MGDPLVGWAHRYTQNGVDSIQTGRGGVWEYSPRFLPNVVRAQGNIVLTGRRARDYVAAEALTHVRHDPGRTVWHHLYDYNRWNDTCTMQLVDAALHQKTCPHAGGCSQYSDAHGVPYRAQPQDPETLQKELESLSAMEPPQVPLCSAKQLEAFTLSTGRNMCRELQMLYNGQRAISRKGRALLAAEEDLWLDAILPLTGKAGTISVTAVMALPDRPGMTLPSDHIALPFAIDPYGNEFWAGADGRVFFCDHETGRCQSAGRSLAAIIH